jgi:hypothetical protein
MGDFSHSRAYRTSSRETTWDTRSAGDTGMHSQGIKSGMTVEDLKRLTQERVLNTPPGTPTPMYRASPPTPITLPKTGITMEVFRST